MEPEEEFEMDEGSKVTLENAGKGLAFMGMLLFLLTITFYLLSRAQPEQYHLFAEFTHVVIMSVIALAFVIAGYALTKVKPESSE